MGDGAVEKVSEPALGMKNQKRKRKGRGVGGWQFGVQIKECLDIGSQWWFFRRAGSGEKCPVRCVPSLVTDLGQKVMGSAQSSCRKGDLKGQKMGLGSN